MRLKIRELDRFAKSKGYKNGIQLIEDMGSSEKAYKHFKRGGKIGGDLVAEIYNRFGEEIFSCIDFGEETLNGFKAKHIEVRNKLY